jgi:hypothetical protein
MDLVKESRKVLDLHGLLAKKSEPDGSPNFIGNKTATTIALDTDIYVSAKSIFISESTALDLLRLNTAKIKNKVIYYDKKLDKICTTDKIPRKTRGNISLLYGEGKPFRGTIDLICLLGLFFSIEEGVVIYNKADFGIELDVLKNKMMINSQTKYIALSHDKLADHINSEHFMNTDNYVKANIIVTPSNIYQAE